MTAPGY